MLSVERCTAGRGRGIPGTVASRRTRVDDYIYTWLNHDQMYERFDVIGEEIFYFIENHSFSNNAVREQYNWNPFTNYKKEGLK